MIYLPQDKDKWRDVVTAAMKRCHNIKLSPATYIAVRTVQLPELQCNTFRHIGTLFKEFSVIEVEVSKVYICHCLTVAATHLNIECELIECSTWLKVSVELQSI